jgi:urease accessory protein
MPTSVSARDYAARAYTIGISGSRDSGKWMLALALCRLLRDSYSIVVVTNRAVSDEDGSREFLIRHKALASTRVAAVDSGRHTAPAIEVLMAECHPELIFLEDAGGDRERIGTLADFTIHVVNGSADRISAADMSEVQRSDLLVINKTHVGAPLDLHDPAVQQCLRLRGDAPTVFAQLRYGIGTIEIASHFLASWRRTSAPEVWALAVDGHVTLTPALA